MSSQDQVCDVAWVLEASLSVVSDVLFGGGSYAERCLHLLWLLQASEFPGVQYYGVQGQLGVGKSKAMAARMVLISGNQKNPGLFIVGLHFLKCGLVIPGIGINWSLL